MAAEAGTQDDVQYGQRWFGVLHVVTLHRLALRHGATDHCLAQMRKCRPLTAAISTSSMP
jgi:hypothetical protein